MPKSTFFGERGAEGSGLKVGFIPLTPLAQKADAGLSVRIANAGGTHLGFGTEGERTRVDPGGSRSC